MQSVISVSVFLSFLLAHQSLCVTIVPRVVSHHQIELEDLREIDRYRANGLAIFNEGFRLQTSNGPIFIKTLRNDRPIREGFEEPNSGYYRKLPAVFPSGIEGYASSSFQLGLPLISSNNRPLTSGSGLYYTFGGQQQQQPQIENVEPQQQLQQQTHQQFQFHNLQQQLQQQQTRQVQIPQPQSQPLVSNQPFANARSFVEQFPQAQQTYTNQGTQQSSNFAESIRVENSINPIGRSTQPRFTAGFSNQIISNEPQKLEANPVVSRNSEFESTLPEELKNPFYRNPQLARSLAQASLPLDGEKIISKDSEWDTHHIPKEKIHSLLFGAGFI